MGSTTPVFYDGRLTDGRTPIFNQTNLQVQQTSPALQGSQSPSLGRGGTSLRFLSLPPGLYTLKAELASFKTFEPNAADQMRPRPDGPLCRSRCNWPV